MAATLRRLRPKETLSRDLWADEPEERAKSPGKQTNKKDRKKMLLECGFMELEGKKKDGAKERRAQLRAV